MNKTVLLICIIYMLLSSIVPAFAGFIEGADAYKRRDYQTAYREFKKAAEQGNKTAQFNLGFMYERGVGVANDDALAAKWYRKAAEQGDSSAQNLLGYMYEVGRGVAKDETEAVKWYTKAAEQGDAAAQVNLGLAYIKGRGIAKDEAEAFKWYKKAAEQGIPGAQYNVGLAYAEGLWGVTKDETQAAIWYKKAAEQGFPKAQQALNVIESNLGISKMAQTSVQPKIITEHFGRSKNYRVKGSLAASQQIGCIPLSKVLNTFTPPDLYQGLLECINQGNYDSAADLSALAGIYARFDAERVTDKTARQAKTVLIMNTFAGVSQETKAKYITSLSSVANDPKRLGALCHEIRKIGMPGYYPSYMILHGIKAFQRNPHDGALLKDFDSQKVWTNLLTTFLHCPI